MKRRIRKSLALCVALLTLCAMTVPALANVNWSVYTYPNGPAGSTTVYPTYFGGNQLYTSCRSFTVTAGTANIRVTAPSYTIHTGFFSPTSALQAIGLNRTRNVNLYADVPVTYTVVNQSSSQAAIDAYGECFTN